MNVTVERERGANAPVTRGGVEGVAAPSPAAPGVTALITCPSCGGDLEFVTEGGTRWERRAVLTCGRCIDTHVLTVTLTSGKAA